MLILVLEGSLKLRRCHLISSEEKEQAVADKNFELQNLHLAVAKAQETIFKIDDYIHLRTKVKTQAEIPLVKRQQLLSKFKGKIVACKHVRQPLEEIFSISELRTKIVLTMLDVGYCDSSNPLQHLSSSISSLMSWRCSTKD